MKRIQKYFTKDHDSSRASAFELSNYRKMEVNTVPRSPSLGLKAPLSKLCAIASILFNPLQSSAQCILGSYTFDINGDGEADLFVGTDYFYTGSFSTIIIQYRAMALNDADQVSFFGGSRFPRSCYFNDCVFPTPDGALSGVRTGDVAVMREIIAGPSGSVFNGSFEPDSTQTLGFLFNNEPHFLELTLNYNGDFYFVGVQKIDGVIAEPCDGGCQDTLKLTCNEVFPIENYKAQKAIITNDSVDVSQMVKLAAGFQIDLIPGFEVLEGGVFEAEINESDCN